MNDQRIIGRYQRASTLNDVEQQSKVCIPGKHWIFTSSYQPVRVRHRHAVWKQPAMSSQARIQQRNPILVMFEDITELVFGPHCRRSWLWGDITRFAMVVVLEYVDDLVPSV